MENAREVGEYLTEGIRSVCCDAIATHRIQDIRGRGLMIGIDLSVPHKDVRVPLIYDKHCFTGCAGTNVLRLLPPLCLSKAEADEFLEKFDEVLNVITI